MAFPSIASTSTTATTSAASSTTISLPTGIASGDLLLVFVRVAASGAVGWPAGWTELFDSAPDLSGDAMALAWRKADGTEGISIEVTHGSGKCAALVWRITGAADPASSPPEASSAATSIGTTPNAPSLTPSGGAADFLWLAIAGNESWTSSVNYPSTFPDARIETSTGAVSPPESNCRIYAAARSENVASQDPPSFSISDPRVWSAFTVAVHPAVGFAATPAFIELEAPDPVLVLMRQILAASPASLELDAPRPLFAGGARISEEQAALASAATLAPVVLAHLTTYSDALAGTVEAEYWWTKEHDVLYPWGGATDRTFEAAILQMGPITRAMSHLPNAGLLDLRRSAVEIVLANEDFPDGSTRWSDLRTRRLLYARLEFAVLLVPPGRRLAGGAAAWDLRDLGGAEHVVWFRGECTRVGPVSATEIPLLFETVEPTIDWPRCTAASECDPRHLGKRYPIPIGQAKEIQVVNRRVGWVTTLAEELATSTATGQRKVTDASGFPDSGSFTLQIGAERVTATKVNPTTVNISARAQQGTQGIAHTASEQVIEILSSSSFVFSGVRAKALDALYAISPLTGERVRILTPFSVNLADTTLDSGRTLGVVTFTSSQFQSMIDAMRAVSQQPSLDSSASTDSIAFQSFSVESPFPEANGVDAILQSSPTRLNMQPVTGADEGWRVYWTSSAGMPSPTARVTRFRVVLTLSGIGGPGGFPNANPTIVRYRMTNIYGRTQTETAYTFDNGVAENNISYVSGWFNPGSGGPFTEAALVDSSGTTRNIRFWIDQGFPGSGGFWDNSHNEAKVEIGSCEIQVETEPASLTDLGIAAVSLGWGLDFVADVQGPTDGGGTLIESPPDAIEWFLSTFSGLGPNAVEGASFAQAAIDLGADILAGDLRLAGESFGEVIAQLCFHSRANLVAREGPLYTTYRLLAAKADNSFAASGVTLTELRDQTETRREGSEQATRFLGHYRLGQIAPLAAVIREEDARELVRIDKEVNDATGKVATAALTSAEQRYGRRDAEPLLFPLIYNRATAIDVLGYYAFESIADRGRFALTVPFGDGYLLELGDVPNFTPRGWASTVKARVIQLSLAPGEPHVGVILEEVT